MQAIAEPLFQSEAKWEAIHVFFYSNANKTHFYQRGFVLTLVLKVRVLELGNPKSPGVEFFKTATNISLESERKFRRPVYIFPPYNVLSSLNFTLAFFSY